MDILQRLQAIAGDTAAAANPRAAAYITNQLKKRYGASRYMPHQGPRETARRRRQFEAALARRFRSCVQARVDHAILAAEALSAAAASTEPMTPEMAARVEARVAQLSGRTSSERSGCAE